MTSFELRVFGQEVTVHRFDTVGGVLDAIVTKKWFRSRAAATKYQRRFQLPTPGVKERRYPFECPGGGHWHLTHYTPAQMAATRERMNQPAPYEESDTTDEQQ